MNILGIHVGAHDSSACLIIDGEIAAAFEEERLERYKHRDAWRPFAPSMLEEDKERHLVNAHTSPLILSFDVVKDNGHEISATVHVDNSTRPQTVSPDYNARYYELIFKFKKCYAYELCKQEAQFRKGDKNAEQSCHEECEGWSKC